MAGTDEFFKHLLFLLALLLLNPAPLTLFQGVQNQHFATGFLKFALLLVLALAGLLHTGVRLHRNRIQTMGKPLAQAEITRGCRRAFCGRRTAARLPQLPGQLLVPRRLRLRVAPVL